MIRVFTAASAVALLLAGAAGTQAPGPAPRPAGEVGRAQATCEALAFEFVREFAASLRGELQPDARSWRGRQQGPAAYRYAALTARRSDDGVWRCIRGGDRIAADELLYLVPRSGTDAGVLLFCVRGDGAAAFSDNARGTSWKRGEALPPGNAVFGSGGSDSMQDFPLTPQRGNDGNMWKPLSMMPTEELALTVVDERGGPFEGATIRCLPHGGDRVDARALPAGTAVADARGRAVLRGLSVRGLGLAADVGGLLLPIGREAVTFVDGGVRLQLTRARIERVRIDANEAAAIATLRNLVAAQAQCQASGAIDADNDGVGEYGMFAELAGAVPVRGGEKPITPPVLSAAFGRLDGGVVVRSGYCFRLFLPGERGRPIAENPRGGAEGLAVRPDQAELMWCAYAWPVRAGASGRRAFFVNQFGDVLSTDNEAGGFSGSEQAPAPDAAFVARDDLRADTALLKRGARGHTWSVVR